MTRPEETLAELVRRFRPEAAKGLRAVYQLHLTGEGGGLWHVDIADEQCHLVAGQADQPDATITMSVKDWTELVAGRLNAFQALMAGRIQLLGDLSLAERLQQLFGF
jgi:putative sterol carrier protein